MLNLSSLRSFIRSSLDQWPVPGIAVCVVHRGQVLMSEGFGYANVSSGTRVDADTLFQIGSNSKQITAAALADLIDRGKASWDTRVTSVLPELRFGSEYVTRNTNIDDLLAHRTGYPDPTAAWYTGRADGILTRVRAQQTSCSFRQGFYYNNVQYVAAGLIAAKLASQSWEEYVDRRLFRPLGMRRTVASSEACGKLENVATPHAVLRGSILPIAPYWGHNLDIFAAAGGVWSSASDMARWLLMLTGKGSCLGHRVISADAVRSLITPSTIVSGDSQVGHDIRSWFHGSGIYAYARGLFVQDSTAGLLAWHAGDIDGMASAVAFLPHYGLGVAVLSNLNGCSLRFPIIAKALGLLHGQELANHAKKLRHADESARDSQALWNASFQKKFSKPRRAIKDQNPPCGTYRSRIAGKAVLYRFGDELKISLGNPDFSGSMSRWRKGVYLVKWNNPLYGCDFVIVKRRRTDAKDTLEIPRLDLSFERAAA